MQVSVAPETGLIQVEYRPGTVDSFDAEGRPVAMVRAGHALRRLPDSTVVEHDPRPDPIGSFRRLTGTVGLLIFAGVHDQLRRRADELIRAVEAVAPWPLAVPPADWVGRVLSWNARRLSGDAERFRSIYGPAGMLPPEPFAMVTLQAAIGCPHGCCTYCTPYRGRPFRVRTNAEFRQHLTAIRDWHGAALRGRRWLFCGEADVLAVPTATLTELLAVAAERFTVAPPALTGRRIAGWLRTHPDGCVGFCGFVDERSGACKGYQNFVRLRAAGLRRAYVALETGYEALHHSLHKPGTVGDAVRTVATLHEAGIEVGLFILVGAGGQALSNAHLEHTARALRRMELQPEDVVYLSPLNTPPASEYERWSSKNGVGDLTRGEIAVQLRNLADAVGGPRAPRVDLYHLEEHLY